MTNNKLVDVSLKSNHSQKSAQDLSDLLDDNVSDEAFENLLADDSQAETWFRYNLVRSVLKKEDSAFASFDFTQAVSAQIAKEPALNIAPRKTAQIIPFWKKTTGGLALAASVAFAMVFSVQMMSPSSPNQMNATSGLASQNNQSVLPLKAVDSQYANNSQYSNAEFTTQEQNQQAHLNDVQRYLNQINELNLNENEQLVGGEVMVKSFIVKTKPVETPFEEKIRRMKKPSESNN